MTDQDAIDIVLEHVPELRLVYDEHLEVYEELLASLLLEGEMVDGWFIPLVRGGASAEAIERFLAAMEALLASEPGKDAGWNRAVIAFTENLTAPQHEDVLRRVWNMFGPATKASFSREFAGQRLIAQRSPTASPEPQFYEVCEYCRERFDFSRAAIVLGSTSRATTPSWTTGAAGTCGSPTRSASRRRRASRRLSRPSLATTSSGAGTSTPRASTAAARAPRRSASPRATPPRPPRGSPRG